MMRVARGAVFVSVSVILSAGIAIVPPCRGQQLSDAAAKEQIVRDWMLQDHGQDVGKCFTNGDSADLEARMVETVFKELSGAAKPLEAEMAALVKTKAPGKDPRWKELYVKACEARRRARLQSLLETTKKVVFVIVLSTGNSEILNRVYHLKKKVNQ